MGLGPYGWFVKIYTAIYYLLWLLIHFLSFASQVVSLTIWSPHLNCLPSPPTIPPPPLPALAWGCTGWKHLAPLPPPRQSIARSLDNSVALKGMVPVKLANWVSQSESDLLLLHHLFPRKWGLLWTFEPHLLRTFLSLSQFFSSPSSYIPLHFLPSPLNMSKPLTVFPTLS